jgi:hypothetical protein
MSRRITSLNTAQYEALFRSAKFLVEHLPSYCIFNEIQWFNYLPLNMFSCRILALRLPDTRIQTQIGNDK